MLKFISFGSGSSGNCYYLFSETEGLLIDVGVGIRTLRKQFNDYGLDFSNGIKGVLVTHDHADHIKSVGSFSKRYNCPVYTTCLVHTGMDRNYCMRNKLAVANRKYMQKGTTYSIGGFSVTPFNVPHDSMDNNGYFVEYEGVTFGLLTDVGHITDEMKTIINKVNYLVIEANYDKEMLANGPYPLHLQERISSGNGHLSNMQCAQAIAQYHSDALKHVWLCHLSEENNRPDVALACVRDILMQSGIRVGEQLKLDVLRRKMPTGIFNLE